MDNNLPAPDSGQHRGGRYSKLVCSARSNCIFLELIDTQFTTWFILPRRWLNHCLKFREMPLVIQVSLSSTLQNTFIFIFERL